MTPVYPVRVVLDNDQHRVPLVAAKSPEEARVRARGLGFGKRRVARVEQEEAGMTSNEGLARFRRWVFNEFGIKAEGAWTEEFDRLLGDAIPVVPVGLSPDGDLRAALAAGLGDALTIDWPGDTRLSAAPAIADYLMKRPEVRDALAATPATPPPLDAAVMHLALCGSAWLSNGAVHDPQYPGDWPCHDLVARYKAEAAARLFGDQQAAEDRERHIRTEDEFRERPCPSCGAALAPADTHWDLIADAYACSAEDRERP